MFIAHMTIEEILSESREFEAVRFLFNNLEQEIERLYHENSRYSACLKAIRKINNGKDEAIDALCEKED